MNISKAWLSLGALSLLGFQIQAQAQDHDGVTYNGEVGRIINDNCVVCHREGGIGPMQFENYEQVRPWAPLIQFKVASREMRRAWTPRLLMIPPRVVVPEVRRRGAARPLTAPAEPCVQ